MRSRILFGFLMISFGFAQGAACQLPQDLVQSQVSLQKAIHTYSANIADIQSKIDKSLEAAGAAAQTQASQIPAIPVQPSAPPQNVSTGQKALLMQKIGEFENHAKSSEILYSRWALAFVIGAAFLALVGSIFSFAKKHVVAGVVGLIVTAAIGFANAYPLNPTAEFYRKLEGQAHALQVDCQLKEPFTVDFYNSAATQLRGLILEESIEKPGFGNYKGLNQNATDQIQQIKVNTEGLEKAKAVAIERDKPG